MAKKTIEEIAAWLAENEVSLDDVGNAINYHDTREEELAEARDGIVEAFYNYFTILFEGDDGEPVTYDELAKFTAPLFKTIEMDVKKREKQKPKSDYYTFFKTIGLV